jgi:ABC-type polysaccharide transport system permease subunit
MAWALYLPKKFRLSYSLFDILFFSFFGALGEALLIKNGLMVYTGGWTTTHAFFGYFVTWVILHTIRYKVLEV